MVVRNHNEDGLGDEEAGRKRCVRDVEAVVENLGPRVELEVLFRAVFVHYRQLHRLAPGNRQQKVSAVPEHWRKSKAPC